ncbi:MAG: 2Fe-2S iron-sulfur cluster-binding protein [Bacteroidota bacterium]
MKIEVTDTNGQKRQLEIQQNPSGNLMEILTEENFDVPAICGGMISCGTCHVHILSGYDNLEPPEEDEAFLVESLDNFQEGKSRLSCQVFLTDELDGAVIKVASD